MEADLASRVDLKMVVEASMSAVEVVPSRVDLKSAVEASTLAVGVEASTSAPGVDPVEASRVGLKMATEADLTMAAEADLK